MPALDRRFCDAVPTKLPEPTWSRVRAACDNYSTPHHLSRRVLLAGGGEVSLATIMGPL
jgi:hypothetical protein